MGRPQEKDNGGTQPKVRDKGKNRQCLGGKGRPKKVQR